MDMALKNSNIAARAKTTICTRHPHWLTGRRASDGRSTQSNQVGLSQAGSRPTAEVGRSVGNGDQPIGSWRPTRKCGYCPART